MPRKRKLPPLPKDDGKVKFRTVIVSAEVAQVFARGALEHYDPRNYPHWRDDPSYHWRQQVKERKNAVGKTRSTD